MQCLSLFWISPLFLLLASCANTDTDTQPVAPADAPPGYRLVFADEFDVDGKLNPEVWRYENGFVRNRELQWYQPDNAIVRDGCLVITGRRETRPNPNYKKGSRSWKEQRPLIEYTSASVMTRGKRDWRYGRFEIRAKITADQGLWPAIWTIGSTPRSWPYAGEIDLMEYYGNSILANAAWGSDKPNKPIWDTVKTPVGELGDETWDQRFHIWRMDWDEQAIKLYIDDRLLNTIELSKTKNRDQEGLNPFHLPQYLILNLAIGGTCGGDPSRTQFPTEYLVDYVRVYQKTGQ